jgi:D-glycero-alpha-D-manno-heptose-7-phosphate kinase
LIISRTPYRISFFGGGTDFPAWYRKHGGAVLATSIDKYCYLTARFLPPFFEHRFRVVYSKIEDCHDIDEIQHPAVREILRFLRFDRGVEIHHDGDLPARSGIGSSSSFCVGLLHALYALAGRMPSKQQLATEAIHLEQDVLHETVGSQDQVTSAHGGFNQVVFQQSAGREAPGPLDIRDEISVRPVTISQARMRDLESHLLLFFTGVKRTSSDVAKSYADDLDARKRHLRIMKDLVDEALAVLNGEGDLGSFGELLHESWTAKRGLSAQVSTSEIDAIYESAQAAGALGGKLLGAGGGGFLLLFARPDDHAALKAKLDGLIHVPFRFEAAGSQIIFYDPETEYIAEERARAGGGRRVFRDRGGLGS